jgi:hypothetical protein
VGRYLKRLSGVLAGAALGIAALLLMAPTIYLPIAFGQDRTIQLTPPEPYVCFGRGTDVVEIANRNLVWSCLLKAGGQGMAAFLTDYQGTTVLAVPGYFAGDGGLTTLDGVVYLISNDLNSGSVFLTPLIQRDGLMPLEAR